MATSTNDGDEKKAGGAPATPEVSTRRSVPAVIKVISEYWVAATSVVTIVFGITGALTYFATHAQLEKLECLMNDNLLRQTLPAQVQMLETSLRLAQSELKDIRRGSQGFLAKEQEIQKYKLDLDDSRKRYKELPSVSTKLCEKGSTK